MILETSRYQILRYVERTNLHGCKYKNNVYVTRTLTKSSPWDTYSYNRNRHSLYGQQSLLKQQ